MQRDLPKKNRAPGKDICMRDAVDVQAIDVMCDTLLPRKAQGVAQKKPKKLKQGGPAKQKASTKCKKMPPMANSPKKKLKVLRLVIF